MSDRVIIVGLGFAIVLAISIVYAGLIERAHERSIRNGAQPLPTVRQVRQWRRERLQLATEGRDRNRRRPS